ncbi:hypothetical protein DKE47_009355 [Acinetobacter nosocomialis]|nr:hypothetical protein DKE47_009355 [Acinetobacter nosocomialis]
MFILRFAKALVALSCSGGVFFISEKTKVINFFCNPTSLFLVITQHYFLVLIYIDISSHQYLFTI